MMLSRILFSTAVVFAFVFFYEWLFHGVLMNEMYMQTAQLWRTEAEMEARFCWLVAGQLLFALMITIIFSKGYQNRGLTEGLRFGLYTTLLLSAPTLVMYAVAPYPEKMVLCWIASNFVELITVGVLLSAIFKCCHASANPLPAGR